MDHHDLLSGLVRLHVLHHAAQEPVYGQAMIEELARHGYKLSPGTLYPLLAKMTRDGYLTVSATREGRVTKKYYTITDHGRAGLALARTHLRELKGEVDEEAEEGGATP
nr:PadR family transcriptional regulator [Pararhodospirillum oryzae]